MKKLWPALSLLLTIASCSSFPSPQEGYGLVVIPTTTSNSAGSPFYIYYRLYFKGLLEDNPFPEEYLYYRPSKKKYIAVMLPEGQYKIDSIMPIRDSDKEKFSPYLPTISFEVKNKEVIIVNTLLNVKYEKDITGEKRQRISEDELGMDYFMEIKDELNEILSEASWGKLE